MFAKKLSLLSALVLCAPAHAQFGGTPHAQPQPPAAIQQPATVSLEEIAANFVARGIKSPKGLEYREVEISASGAGDRFILKTHAWIISPAKELQMASVLAWNGWVYPAILVGEQADVRTDIEALLAKKPDSAPNLRYNDSYLDTVSASHQKFDPFKTVMLELLGEKELALRVTSALSSDLNRYERRLEKYIEEYWFWPLASRGISEFRKGDDARALEYIRVTSSVAQSKSDDYRQYGAAVSQLDADLERRVNEKPPIDPNSLEFLIWDLQNIDNHTQERDDATNPRIQKLAMRGDAAVESLLQTFLHDKRLTRRFEPGEGISNQPVNPIAMFTVSDAALIALDSLIFPANNCYRSLLISLRSQNTSPHQNWAGGGQPRNLNALNAPPRLSDDQIKQAVVNQFRLDWAKWKNLPTTERIYQILKSDPDSDQTQWNSAARQLVTPADNPYGGFNPISDLDSPRMGEPLRNGHAPSVSELLVKRLKQLESRRGRASIDAEALTNVLFRWDKAAGQRYVLDRMNVILAEQKADPSNFYDHGMDRLLERAPEAGGPIYAQWLLPFPRVGDSANGSYLQPLWTHLQDPLWRATAKKIFSDPNSPWHEVLPPRTSPDSDARNFVYFSDLTATMLFLVPEWNTLLRQSLKTTQPIATIEWHETGATNSNNVFLNISGNVSELGIVSRDQWIEAKGERPLMFSDYIAWMFSNRWASRRAPKYNPLWNADKRAQAIAELDKWLAAKSGDTTFATYSGP